MRLYVIGDVHGHLDQLKAVHDLIGRDGGRDAVIAYVGDLIDRGPDSRGVVDYLIAGQDAGRRWIVTKGNHDRMLPRFLQDPTWIDPNLSNRLNWTRHPAMGAAATLQSYGVDSDMPDEHIHAELLRAVPDTHRRFLDGLPLWFLHPLALVVHAGIRPGMDLQDQSEEDLVWIRAAFLDCDQSHGPLVVHGHTAIEHPTHYGNRVNVDAGAAYGRALRAVVLEGETVHLLSEQGRVPLLPQPWSGE